jgi:hypothetical protein
VKFRLGGLLVLSAAFFAIWAALALLGVVVRIAPDWPLWAAAMVLAGIAGGLVWLYGYESRAVGFRYARRLVALRLAALGLIAWILLEPTFVRTVTRRIEREVVVLLDESASMKLVDDGQTKSRLAIGREALAAAGVEKKLGERFRVRTVPFARSAAESGQSPSEGWDYATDIAAALASVLDDVPPEQLAGALLVSDGRHNRVSRVEDSARRFGILDAPVGVLAVGDPEPPRDAAVLSVRAPHAVHLGDRMRVDAEVKFDGYQGREAKVRLMRGEETLDEQTVSIPQKHHREELRFIHEPEEGGLDDYRIEIEPMKGERFPENNRWSFETSITEARTNVLLVDSTPRWEFRYLRNLFYGRDKSIHLQWVLTHPDGVDGVRRPGAAASAQRPFGESEATRLPISENQWKKFDVIILGDLAPDAISEKEWEIISRCVNERAAFLVLVAGPRSMPHALRAEAARELVPVDPDWGMKNFYGFGEKGFHFSETAVGRRHPVTRHFADAGKTNTGRTGGWGQFPVMRWRHPVRSLRDGAEVLLTAEDENGDGDDVLSESQPATAADLGAALDALTRRRQREAEQALLVTRQNGLGKVALLLTDRTWRLREGAGDVYHHRFWSNLVRWGAGPLLRAGGDRVALGTDRLDYTADDKLVISARLREPDMSPARDESLRAEILLGDEVVASVPLAPQPGGPGLHEGVAGPFSKPGRYRIRLRGEKAAGLLENEASLPETSIRVVASHGPVELAETTLNRPLLQEIATASGGRVVAPDQAADIIPLFVDEDQPREEVRETPLWDNPLVFLLLAGVLTAEWWLRRNRGLP